MVGFSFYRSPGRNRELVPNWQSSLREKIVRLLKSRGYRVRPDVTMEGMSGRRYEIHIYAEYRAPLHTSRIAVMCLDRREPVGPDEVHELLQILEDLELDVHKDVAEELAQLRG